ncbi:hypothetical protein J1N35_013966 [Gossypium stocksii]|uniref:Uncharacterized protein n=1 Tax=Gossypium stocksii TaxID=47602 RepID=A0A9D3VTB8_9ROSI|nr:hypothetical protein J1N35_013966 [Gossypium stocksii]
MVLCQERGIMPRAGLEILENKGLMNEASIERMTRGKDTPILKEAETSKARMGQLSPSPLSEFLVFPPIIYNYNLSSSDDDVEGQDRPVASPPIVQVSDNEKEEESTNMEECLRKIDNLFKDGIFVDQEDSIIENGERPVKVAEVTSEEQCNSWVIVVYTRPLQVASPTQTTADDVSAEL